MIWKTIPNYKIPLWVKKRRKWKHLKGKTYPYRRKGNVWQKRLRNEWQDKTPWWLLILITIVATLVSTLILRLFGI